MRNELVVAMGERYYSIERPWGVLPEALRLDTVSTVAVDSKGRVYVLQRIHPPVVVFDCGERTAATTRAVQRIEWACIMDTRSTRHATSEADCWTSGLLAPPGVALSMTLPANGSRESTSNKGCP